MLFFYVNDYFGEDIGSAQFRGAADSASGAAAVRGRQPRNTRTGPGTLRIRSGDLLRATEPNGRGNVTKFRATPGGVEVEYGIDKNVVPYAYIHEYGGTIKHPGGTPYRIIDGVFIPVSKARGANLPKTKPHDIRIPARPYFNPGVYAWQKDEWPQVLGRIDKRIRSLF